MNKKKDLKLEITEIFMARASVDRCFFGTIKRLIDENGKPYVYGKINVFNGFVCAQDSDQWELGDRLDDIVLMVLDYGLHNGACKTITIAGIPYFVN